MDCDTGISMLNYNTSLQALLSCCLDLMYLLSTIPGRIDLRCSPDTIATNL
jgi:hypothetical protein